jgi:hypothetical protein
VEHRFAVRVPGISHRVAGHQRQARLMREIAGNIAGRWADEKVLIRLTDDDAVELLAPQELRGRFDVGDEVVVYYEDDGRVAGWMLADENLGVNLRGTDEHGG